MTDIGKDGHLNFSYYADTFIFNYATLSWKQVLTRGFPTYRAQSHLLSDPSTGKTFLVGGYTNLDYVPSRKKFISRSFDDLWQLCIDQPSGLFEAGYCEDSSGGAWAEMFCMHGENVAVRVPDLHAEFEFANRFVGTCKGRVFFCDGQCLKDGWKEHKVRDGCRNPEDPHHRDQKVQSLREMSSIAPLRDSNTCCSSIGISVF
jgi:hypothetical protein